jgi:hypothetical protein
MKARIWKDRRTGRWHYRVKGNGSVTYGNSPTWKAARDMVLILVDDIHVRM